MDQLKNGEIREDIAKSDVFYTFRKVVVSREDFKHIIWNAQHGGQVIYTYSEMPRS